MPHEKSVSRRKFETIWSETLPFIVTAKPSTDLHVCFTCQQNSRLIMKSANMPEQLKTERVQKAFEHLDGVHKERKYYRQECNNGANELWRHFLLVLQVIFKKCITAMTMHNNFIIL